jgi:hypothetical protein
MGRKIAERKECGSFQASQLKKNLPELRSLTTLPRIEFEPRLVDLCASCGLIVLFIPELPGTHLYGAASWITSDKALVQLSLRRKKDDFFWFTFFHELGHILLHPKREAFIDAEGAADSTEEREANEFAAETLIRKEDLQRFFYKRKPTINNITEFAESVQIAPGIVVGRLQRDGVLSWSAGNSLKKSLV